MSAFAGDISFFTVAFGVVWYKRRNVFNISSVVVPCWFALSRACLKISAKHSAKPLDCGW